MSDQPPRRWIAWTFRSIVSVVILAAGLGVAQFLLATAPKMATVEGTQPPPQVKVFKAQQIALRRQWRGYGTVMPMDAVDVPARVTAIVISRPETIRPGSFIKATQLLVQLDGSDFQRQVDIATQRIADLDTQLTVLDIDEARLRERIAIETKDVALAESEYLRLRGLFEKNAAKQNEVDAAHRAWLSSQKLLLATRELQDKIEPRRVQWKALRAGQEEQLKLAALSLERCRITSPIDGVVAALDVDEGENIAAGQRVARVVSLDRVEVPVQLPAAAREDVAVGGEATLLSHARQLACAAKISRIAPEEDPSTRTMTAYVEVNQKELVSQFGSAGQPRLLTPGRFLEAVVDSREAQPRWVVPRRSIRAGRVLVVKDGIVRSRPVTIDYLNEGALPQLGVPDDQWAVLSGDAPPLAEGELIVLNASVAVRDGDKVEPLLPSPPATAPVAAPPVEQSSTKAPTGSGS